MHTLGFMGDGNKVVGKRITCLLIFDNFQKFSLPLTRSGEPPKDRNRTGCST